MRLSLVRPAAPNTYRGSASSLLPKHADCGPSSPPAHAGGSLGRVPETLPCPRLADQSGRLTWASEAAAWSRRVAGRQVRCRLNRRAAVATSLRSTRDKIPAYRTAGQSSRARSGGSRIDNRLYTVDARKHHGIAPRGVFQNSRLLAASLVAFVPGVPQLAVSARPHGAGLAQGGLRDAGRHVVGVARRGTGTPSRAHSSSVPS